MSRAHFPLFEFKVLIEFDQRFRVFVGYCLETGSVVTADKPDMAKNMMKELLEDEISFAIQHNNVRNLLSSAAPLEIWKKWQEAAKAMKPEIVELNYTAQEIALDEPEVELSIATAA
jgi:hypothetical protein